MLKMDADHRKYKFSDGLRGVNIRRLGIFWRENRRKRNAKTGFGTGIT